MSTPPGYWAAIRLTAFANCEISEANWRTLWRTPRTRGFQPARHPRETAARPGFTPEDICGSIWSSINAEGRAPREWEVLDAQAATASRMITRLPAAEALLQRHGPIEDSPYRPWPRRDAKGRHLGYEGLCSLQGKTRARLEGLCAGQWRPMILTLRRRRFGSVRLVFFKHPQLVSVPAAVPNPETTLDLHLDRLFLDTLIAGLWGRFYRCEGCGYFGVRERSGERSRQLCDRSRCRVARHRAKRKAESDALAKKVRAAVRACTEPDRTEAVRRQFGLSQADMNRLLR